MFRFTDTANKSLDNKIQRYTKYVVMLLNFPKCGTNKVEKQQRIFFQKKSLKGSFSDTPNRDLKGKKGLVNGADGKEYYR